MHTKSGKDCSGFVVTLVLGYIMYRYTLDTMNKTGVSKLGSAINCGAQYEWSHRVLEYCRNEISV